MIKFFKGVLVIRIYRSKEHKRQVELCVFPPFKNIPLHLHRDEDIELIHVFGSALYRVRKVSKGISILYKATTRKDFLRSFTIKNNEPHGAAISWTGLITLSCQTWINDVSPHSVTNDFIEVKE